MAYTKLAIHFTSTAHKAWMEASNNSKKAYTVLENAGLYGPIAERAIADYCSARDIECACFRRWNIQQKWAERAIARLVRAAGTLGNLRTKVDIVSGDASIINYARAEYGQTVLSLVAVGPRGIVFLD